MNWTQLARLLLVVHMGFAAAALDPGTGRGIIRSTNGAPLQNVWVQELGTWREGMTKSDGAFTFPLGAPVTLLLHGDGFRPEMIRTEGAGTNGELSITMKPELDAVRLRLCNPDGTG